MGRQYHRWIPEEKRFVRDNTAGRSHIELTGMFNKRFGCQVTVEGMKSFIKRRGLCLYPPGRKWTPEEIQFLRDNTAGRPYAELTEMFNKRFGCQVTGKKISSFLTNHRLGNGNKGRSPIGSEREECGYTVVKTADPDVWVKKQRVVWEAANGRPVPKGHTVIFADGDRSNFAIENLLLVSSGELGYMHRFGFRFPDRELTEEGHALAALRLAVAERKRELGIGAPKWTAKKKQGADRYDNGTETEEGDSPRAGNNPAGKEAAV